MFTTEVSKTIYFMIMSSVNTHVNSLSSLATVMGGWTLINRCYSEEFYSLFSLVFTRILGDICYEEGEENPLFSSSGKVPIFCEIVAIYNQKSESFKMQKFMTEVLIFSHHSPKVLLFLCAVLYSHFCDWWRYVIRENCNFVTFLVKDNLVYCV